MKKFILSVSVLAVALAPALVAAADLRVARDEFSLQKGLTINDDLYIAGGNLALAGDIKGDIVAAGGNISVSGVVDGDLLVAGGTLNILGEVKDDVRVAGGTVIVSGNIGGDLVIAGGQVQILPNATIAGDLIAAGGTITIDGAVRGDVEVRGGKLFVNSMVGGNVNAYVDEVAIGESSIVAGNFMYESRNAAKIAPGAQIKGTTDFRKLEAVKVSRNALRALFGTFLIAKFLVILASALFLTFLFRKGSGAIVNQATSQFGKELLRGFILLVVVPVAVVVLCITIVGIPLGILALLIYLFVLLFAHLYSYVLFGSWMFKMVGKKTSYEVTWKTTILGVVALSIISLIPFIGWIVKLIFFLSALGAIAKVDSDRSWLVR